MKIVFGILRAMPLWFLNIFFSFLMLVVYAAIPKRRKITQNNIKMAIGGNYKKAAVKTYLYFGRMIALNVKYLGDKKFILEHFKVTGMENYEYAKSLNKGIIVTTAHFGNWEMMVCAFGLLYEPVKIMARPMDNKSLDKLVNGIRESCKNRVLSARMSAFSFIKLLKKNEVLGVLIDQAGGDGSFRVDFFGKKAKVSESIALFSYKLGTPILPAYMKEHGDGTFEIIIEKPIVSHRLCDMKKDVEETMRNVYSRFEEWITKEPEKYLWMHNRWK